MAQTNLTPQEFIRTTFTPQLCVLCSDDAEAVCMKNNLQFVELLQPFSKINSEVNVTDPSGNKITIKNFQVHFVDIKHRPPEPLLGKKILSEAVSSCTWNEDDNKLIENLASGTKAELNLPISTPWFEDWREIFLRIQYPSDHEFTKHYIACILVVSAGSENPLDQLNKLFQYQHQLQHQNTTRFPKWFSPNILKYYLVLQDVVETSNNVADKVYEQVTSVYGSANCHLLRINSRTNSQTESLGQDVWHKVARLRNIMNGGKSAAVVSSHTSSGSETPRDDGFSLPSRVVEGDDLEPSVEPMMHPLSPASSPVEERNGLLGNIPADVPVMNSSENLSLNQLQCGQPMGTSLTSSDMDRIKIFVQEFCLRSLIPHVERQIRYLNDVLLNRSKSKSLLSATRRWLGGTKNPSSSSNSVIYSQEATELQMRRLGDLCFMFGLYDLAYSSYYTAKNDFKSDQAWLYFAGAQEMASLSLIMQNNSDYQKRYLESSLHTYLNICKVYNFAIRTTLLSTEILKYYKEFGEAAMTLIKMTSEESDLLSALMLEQAAYCFVNSKRPLLRKYAFHMTLAGHRYSKAGLRSHSFRAYKQAFQVYFKRGWMLAEDHIHYSMGKQAYQMKMNKESFNASKLLLDKYQNGDCGKQQNPTQQGVYVREFLNIFQKCTDEGILTSDHQVSLRIPPLDAQQTKILIGDLPDKPSDSSEWIPASHISFHDEDAKETRWHAMEREILTVISGPIMVFKPNLIRLTSSTPNTRSPKVPLGEQIFVELHFKNPMLISLTLSDIAPIYQCYDEGNNAVRGDCVQFEPLSEFYLTPESKLVITLAIKPLRLGHIHIKAVSYRISLTQNSTPEQKLTSVSAVIQQDIEVKGHRLNNTLSERCSVVYANDQRMNIEVIPSMPKLGVSFRNLPSIMSCGEVKNVDVRFANVGLFSLTNLYVAVSDPQNVFLLTKSSVLPEVTDTYNFLDGDEFKNINRIQRIDLPDDNQLTVGEEFFATLWLHAPTQTGAFDVELLFYYESTDPALKKRYQLIRHYSSIYLYPSISLKLSCEQSLSILPVNKDSLPRHAINLVLNLKNKCDYENGGEEIELIGITLNSPLYYIMSSELKTLDALKRNSACQFSVQCVYEYSQNRDKYLASQLSFNEKTALPICWTAFSMRERLKLPELTVEPPPSNPMSGYDHPTPSQEEVNNRKLNEASLVDIVATIAWRSRRGSECISGLHSGSVELFGQSAHVGQSKTVLGTALENPPVKFYIEEPTNDEKVPVAKEKELSHLVNVSVNLPSVLVHEFNMEPLCKLNFDAVVYNSTSCPLEVYLSSSSEPSGDSSGSEAVRGAHKLLVTSLTRRRFRLGPFESKLVPCRALVAGPGSYVFGSSFKVEVRPQDSKRDWIAQDSQSPVSNVILVKCG